MAFGVLLVLMAGTLVVVVGRASTPGPRGPAPSLAQLDASLALAEVYLDGLYKALPDGEAVQSEAYGLPLRVWLPLYSRWVLLGEGASGDCYSGAPCQGLTTISAAEDGPRRPDKESYDVTFDTPQERRSVRAQVTLDWGAPGGRFAVVTNTFTSSDPRAAGAELWLDRSRLADLPSGGPTADGGSASPLTILRPATTMFALESTSVMRSLRYTVRHATQSAFLYWSLKARAPGTEDAVAKAAALAKFLRNNGYTPGVDIRAAVFGLADGLADSFPFQQEAYPDCDHLPAATPIAYPYASKVCLLGVQAFLLAGRADAFLQESEALLVLGTSGRPDAHYPGPVALGMPSSTAAGTADDLRRAWDRLGYGVPACTPAACEQTRASGLRTFQFGELATLLAYGHGRRELAPYADAVAAQAVAVQVDSQGHIRTVDGLLTRPAQRGAFPIFFDASHRFIPTTGTMAEVTERLSMPPEYGGVSVSDAETSFDAWAFLAAYRCARYQKGCETAPYGQLLAERASASHGTGATGSR